jgi:hypothetical protein
MNSDGLIDILTRGGLATIAVVVSTVGIWQLQQAQTTLVRLVNAVTLIPAIGWGWFYLCTFRTHSAFIGTLPITVWVSRIIVLLTLAAVLLIQLAVKEVERDQ